MTPAKDSFAVLDRRIYPAGRLIYQKDDLGSSAFYLKRGAVEIFKNDGTRDIPIATLTEGQIFGEMALLGSGRRSTSARAMAECECIFISGGDMERLMGNAEAGVRALIRVLAQRLRDLNDKIEECPETGKFRIKAEAS